MNNIDFEKHKSPKFELVIQLRDHNGNLTGKTKSFCTDDAAELERFWERNNGVGKEKKEKLEKKNKKNNDRIHK